MASRTALWRWTLVAVAALGFAPLLRAATITVNSTADCDTAGCDSGNATLRMAIESVNAGSDQADVVADVGTNPYGTSDTIQFSLTYPATITLGSALPSLSTSVAITGPGAASLTISGADTYRVFVFFGVTGSISDLTIAHGLSQGGSGGGGPASGGGGGAGIGAGLWAFISNLSLTSVTFDHNQAAGGEGGSSCCPITFDSAGGGGGVDSIGTSAFGSPGDSASGNGGDGGTGSAPLTLGSGGAGGVQFSSNGGLGSQGSGGGGAAAYFQSHAGGGGRFAGGGGGNVFTAGGKGGAYGGGGGSGNGSGPGGTMLNASTTLGGAGASAEGGGNGGGGGSGVGGAIWVGGGVLTLSDCTFTDNTASGGSGGLGDPTTGGNGLGKGGAVFSDGATLTQICGNVFSNNTASDAAGTATDNNDIYGTLGASTDVTNPVITCPVDQLNVPNDAGLCSAAVDPGTATATDDCAVKSIDGVRSDSLALTDPYPVGTTTITWTATDTSGNTAQCTQTISVVDTEKPVVTSSVSVGVLVNDHTMRNVGFSESATDNCSGNLTNSATIEIYSSEPEQAPTGTGGDGTTSPDARGRGTCNNSGIWVNKIALRQERLNNGPGRIYLIKTSARDGSNNTAWSCATVVSPRSSKKADLNKVLSAATAVRNVCNQFGAIPSNYYLIGCGPVIGSKQ